MYITGLAMPDKLLGAAIQVSKVNTISQSPRTYSPVLAGRDSNRAILRWVAWSRSLGKPDYVTDIEPN